MALAGGHLRPPGDVLVGKVSPKSKTELTPEEKLPHATFGRAGEDVKTDSLEVLFGVEGIVIDTQNFSRRMSLSEEDPKAFENSLKEAEAEGNARIAAAFGALIRNIDDVLEEELNDQDGSPLVEAATTAAPPSGRAVHVDALDIRSPECPAVVENIYKLDWPLVEPAIDARDRKLNSTSSVTSPAAACYGEGVHCGEARSRGRQDGRPARQQGRDLQGAAQPKTRLSWPTARRSRSGLTRWAFPAV